jgi:hypothetical protein
MTAFSFSLEQLRSAPPEVRRWAEREIAASLAQIAGPVRQLWPAQEAALAACTPDEAAQLFDLIKGDYLLSQVFFELGREAPGGPDYSILVSFTRGDPCWYIKPRTAWALTSACGLMGTTFATTRCISGAKEMLRYRAAPASGTRSPAISSSACAATIFALGTHPLVWG